MRKILYSPGYGAGWTSWNDGEVAAYMLEYAPIVEAIENKTFTFSEKDPLCLQLEKECQEKFGENKHVCLLGADQLRVYETSGRVRINEYDGCESVEEEGGYQGWM